jgi:hypothetical protein
MPQYQYAPLNASTGEIRLVELHPGAFDDPISISIITTPFIVPAFEPHDEDRLGRIRKSLPAGWRAYETLEGRILFRNKETELTTWDHPNPHHDRRTYESESSTLGASQVNFEALSYNWGSPNNRVMIQVVLPSRLKVGTKEASLTIQENLHDALKHLRYAAHPRTLWIDAVCIDQDNLMEKSHQVRRMGDIYTYAQRVVVWLGLASANSTLAMHKLEYIGRQVECSIDKYYLPAPHCTEKNWYSTTEACDIDRDSGTWYAICSLLQRPWFDRLWIRQEIQLANNSAFVQCGTDIIQWRQLRRAIILCGRNNFLKILPPRLSWVPRYRRELALGFKNRAPTHLFRDAIFAKCSDPRDKVYALLGLFPSVLAQRIHPRYDRSALDVCREAFRAYVECTERLDILDLVGPSWIRDWSVQRNSMGYEVNFSSSNSIADVSYINPDKLMVSGMEHDTVEEIAGPLPADDDTILEKVWNVWLKDATISQIYPTGESLASACAWTLNHGYLRDRLRFPSYKYVVDALPPFERLEQQKVFVSDPNVRLWKSKITANSFLFRSQKGFFGFSPIEVKPGDRVCVLLGCPRPVLLREQPSSSHLFVGCVHIHGLMDGEALLGPLPQGCRVILFQEGNNDHIQEFVDSKTQTRSTRDPRLGPLPAEWKPIITKDRLWPSKRVEAFQNRDTGQILYSDPRLLPDALRARGVPLQTFTLV